MKPLQIYWLSGLISEQRGSSLEQVIKQQGIGSEDAAKKEYNAEYAAMVAEVQKGLQSDNNETRQCAQTMLNVWNAFKDKHLALPMIPKAIIWKDLSRYLHLILHSDDEDA